MAFIQRQSPPQPAGRPSCDPSRMQSGANSGVSPAPAGIPTPLHARSQTDAELLSRSQAASNQQYADAANKLSEECKNQMRRGAILSCSCPRLETNAQGYTGVQLGTASVSLTHDNAIDPRYQTQPLPPQVTGVPYAGIHTTIE